MVQLIVLNRFENIFFLETQINHFLDDLEVNCRSGYIYFLLDEIHHFYDFFRVDSFIRIFYEHFFNDQFRSQREFDISIIKIYFVVEYIMIQFV